tara:strand:- start:101 stop:787 length:687 start_codon:yes stop_codon:yes gene_type:complete
MKKLLVVSAFIILHSSAFALVGFGFQGGTDLNKLGAYTHTDGPITIESFEMEANPANYGAYAFVDLFGYALEGEADFALSEYNFKFKNDFTPDSEPYEFVWARASYAVTLKKNIMDISIPFLAEAALNAGAGYGAHISTPRANVGMVQALLGDDLTNVNAEQEDLTGQLVDYLEENMIEASGVHLQAGLRFKLLTFDTHANLRYTIAENVYDGSNGFMQFIIKLGFAL